MIFDRSESAHRRRCRARDSGAHAGRRRRPGTDLARYAEPLGLTVERGTSASSSGGSPTSSSSASRFRLPAASSRSSDGPRARRGDDRFFCFAEVPDLGPGAPAQPDSVALRAALSRGGRSDALDPGPSRRRPRDCTGIASRSSCGPPSCSRKRRVAEHAEAPGSGDGPPRPRARRRARRSRATRKRRKRRHADRSSSRGTRRADAWSGTSARRTTARSSPPHPTSAGSPSRARAASPIRTRSSGCSRPRRRRGASSAQPIGPGQLRGVRPRGGRAVPGRRERRAATRCGVVFGIISTPTRKHPEGMRRVLSSAIRRSTWARSPPAECDRIVAGHRSRRARAAARRVGRRQRRRPHRDGQRHREPRRDRARRAADSSPSPTRAARSTSSCPA